MLRFLLCWHCFFDHILRSVSCLLIVSVLSLSNTYYSVYARVLRVFRIAQRRMKKMAPHFVATPSFFITLMTIIITWLESMIHTGIEHRPPNICLSKLNASKFLLHQCCLTTLTNAALNNSGIFSIKKRRVATRFQMFAMSNLLNSESSS